MKLYPTYSVAIRTLGTAGEKYLQELKSLDKQTIQPEHIFVYIPHGFKIPEETIGREEYIRCAKGMVTQRSLSFNEISSDFILFLDDDIYLPEDCVQKLLDGIVDNNGDVISADIYNQCNAPFLLRFSNFLGGTIPHWDKKWAFKVRKSSFYSYNANPPKDVMLTQSACGALVMLRKSLFQSIHFEDERWMEHFGFPSIEDQILHQKLRYQGAVDLVHYKCGAIHLDAGSGHIRDPKRHNKVMNIMRYMLWYRSLYDIEQSRWKKFVAWIAFYTRIVLNFPIALSYTLRTGKLFYVTQVFSSIAEAKRYIASDKYKSIPKFDAYRNK